MSDKDKRRMVWREFVYHGVTTVLVLMSLWWMLVKHDRVAGILSFILVVLIHISYQFSLLIDIQLLRLKRG